MPNVKRTADSKRIKLPRDMTKAPKFIKDCERLSRSGKHDMHRLKEAMMLIIANDGPLPPEWNDHDLKGEFDNLRECHLKGDLLLTYRIEAYDGDSLVTFMRAGTHSELFGK